MTNIFKKTAEFNRSICGINPPAKSARLDPERVKWFFTAAEEEITEFMLSDTLEDDADAILDLIYFAGGRLYEMGIDAEGAFNAIHEANMKKVRGELAKRPGSKGHDAIKPDGWMPPNIKPFMAPRRPKILVLGHARHGKDTVSEMLANKLDLKFTSSSAFCAEKVIWPALWHAEIGNAFRNWRAENEQHYHEMGHEMELMRSLYVNVGDCYNDRGSHRSLCFDLIRWHNRMDMARLGLDIFAENDIYCGLRNAEELVHLARTGVVDHIIWVDASKRVDPEPETSCTVTKAMANVVLNNNGTEESLETAVNNLILELF